MNYLEDNALGIYTDGSSYSGPRRGGIGIRFVWVDDDGNEAVDEVPSFAYPGATSNQMELKACIEALRIATGKHPPVDPSRYDKVVIFTDSTYIYRHFEAAKFEWPATGYTLRGGQPVANAELWKELVKLVVRVAKRVEVRWVKGKSSPHTKRVDKLAKRSAKSTLSQRPLSHVRLRRKRSPRSVEPGSVKMEGQRVAIRIISDEFLRMHRLMKYRYEVVSDDSPYFERVDFIYSTPDLNLNRGHTYDVLFNDNTQNPRIVELFGEVVPT